MFLFKVEGAEEKAELNSELEELNGSRGSSNN